ncbi:SDR family oxidoreductase [Aureispira anguillae]|uniref:Aldehyde reductase n=1 Tax=Aureispira anguillae TaxID=2864201 RepID=A0A915VKH3_9BACT|nr:aldehyde reductase [Aureispira anguillae]BDS09664.1 aldehyde reductase [Aureispira anguillae]
MIDKNTPVLVTGGSGYIASWVVKKLLEQGYLVNATVRNKSKIEKVDHLLKLQTEFPQRLKLYEADLLKKGSFEKAMEGCELVIHMASPFKINVKDAQKELVDPALEGTRNILNQVNATPSVKRVVLTSSVVAIYGDAADAVLTKNGIFTEEYWNTSSSLKHQPYSYSKTLAEQEAWKLQKAQQRWDLVVINPSFVMGPSLSNRKDGESTDFMIQMLSGNFKTGVPNMTFGLVDVRDVAEAHILAGTKASASGRHITCNRSHTMLEIAKILKQEFGTKFKLPSSELPKFLLYIVGPLMGGLSWKFISGNVGFPLNFDNSYSQKDLGLTYRKIAETLKDHADQLIESGHVKLT